MSNPKCAIAPKCECTVFCQLSHFCKLSQLTPTEKKAALRKARNKNLAEDNYVAERKSRGWIL
jgi:hypothetical protein